MAPLNLVSDGDSVFRYAVLCQIVASFIIRRERHDLNAVNFLLDDRTCSKSLDWTAVQQGFSLSTLESK